MSWLFGGFSKPPEQQGGSGGHQAGPRPLTAIAATGGGHQQARKQLVPTKVVPHDLKPRTANQRCHTLDEFCRAVAGATDMTPQMLDLLFFSGSTAAAAVQRAGGLFSNVLLRPASCEWSHVAVTYVGCDGVIGLFEAVRNHEGLADLLTNTPNKTGVRMVRLRDKLIHYARMGECVEDNKTTGERIVKVGLMRFEVVGAGTTTQLTVHRAHLYSLFEDYQTRVSTAGWTESTLQMAQAQLPAIYGNNSEDQDEFFCSKLSTRVYMAIGALQHEFPAAGQTPGTLSARTLPLWEQYRLGPELWSLYVSVPRIEWDATYRMAELERQLSLLRANYVPRPQLPPPLAPQQQQYRPYAPPPQRPQQPPPAAAESVLFLDSIQRDQVQDHEQQHGVPQFGFPEEPPAPPSVVHEFQYHAPMGEPEGQPAQTEELRLRPDDALEAATFAWMNSVDAQLLGK